MPLVAALELPTEQRQCETHGSYDAVFLAGRWAGCPKCAAARSGDWRKRLDIERDERTLKGMRDALKLPERCVGAEAEHCGAFGEKALAWLNRALAGAPGALLIWGSVGTGKTYLACAIAKLAVERRVRSLFISTSDYIMQVRATWDGDGRETDVFDLYTKIPLLVFDEVGDEEPNDKDAHRLRLVIAKRNELCLPTIYTTNKILGQRSADDVRKESDFLCHAIGPRIYSRLVEGLTEIRMVGEDRRRVRK